MATTWTLWHRSKSLMTLITQSSLPMPPSPFKTESMLLTRMIWETTKIRLMLTCQPMKTVPIKYLRSETWMFSLALALLSTKKRCLSRTLRPTRTSPKSLTNLTTDLKLLSTKTKLTVMTICLRKLLRRNSLSLRQVGLVLRKSLHLREPADWMPCQKHQDTWLLKLPLQRTKLKSKIWLVSKKLWSWETAQVRPKISQTLTYSRTWKGTHLTKATFPITFSIINRLLCTKLVEETLRDRVNVTQLHQCHKVKFPRSNLKHLEGSLSLRAM